MAAVPKDTKPRHQTEKKAPTSKEKKAAKDASKKSAEGGASNTFEAYEKLLNSIPMFAGFGKLFKVILELMFSLSTMIRRFHLCC